MNLASEAFEYIEVAKLTNFGVMKSLFKTTENSLRVVINKLVRQGRILNPTRGVYVAKSADPFWVATALYPGYITLSAALYLHNLIDEYPFTIFVASERYRNLTSSHE
jgi:predicted transcriptional regulator of viral defense system